MARFLALDWDHQQLHLVAATVGGGGVRIQRAAVWQEERSPNPAEAEALGKLLRERLKAAGIAPAPVLVTVGRDRVILKEVRYPTVPESEEPAIVRFQAVKELTDPAEEVIIDYTSAGDASATGEKRAWALVMRRELLATYQTLCKAAGLKLVGVTPRPFGTVAALRRLVGTSVLTPAPDPPDAAMAVLTLTERWAEFCVVRGDTLLFARSLAPGSSLAGEVRRNLAVYLGQSQQNPVRAVYLAGGAEHATLRQRLQDMLAIPIHSFDPFGGVEKPELPTANRGAFAGAVGLLHAQAQRQPLAINFAKPKQPKPPRDPNRRKVLFGAALAASVLVAAVAYGVNEVTAKGRVLSGLALEKSTLDRELAQMEDDAKRIKALEDWTQSSIVWLDELYDLTDRFPDPSKVFLMQMTAVPLTRSAISKDKYVAKLELKGGTTEDFRPLDDLISSLSKDGHYSVGPRPTTPNRMVDGRRYPLQFTTSMKVEKLPATKYVRQMAAPPPEPEDRRRRDLGLVPAMGFEIGDFGGAMP